MVTHLVLFASNVDVEDNEEEEDGEEEQGEEEEDDLDAMDEDEYLAKVINKGGEVRKFQAGHRKFYPSSTRAKWVTNVFVL